MTQPLTSNSADAHPYDYLRILYKWRKPAILCFAAIAVIIVAVASFIATPIYKATSRILIDRDIPRALEVRQMLPSDAQRGQSSTRPSTNSSRAKALCSK